MASATDDSSAPATRRSSRWRTPSAATSTSAAAVSVAAAIGPLRALHGGLQRLEGGVVPRQLSALEHGIDGGEAAIGGELGERRPARRDRQPGALVETASGVTHRGRSGEQQQTAHPAAHHPLLQVAVVTMRSDTLSSSSSSAGIADHPVAGALCLDGPRAASRGPSR